jgi:hypothetical protein
MTKGSPQLDLIIQDEVIARLKEQNAKLKQQRDSLAEAGRMCVEIMDTTSITRMRPAQDAMKSALANVKGEQS